MDGHVQYRMGYDATIQSVLNNGTVATVVGVYTESYALDDIAHYSVTTEQTQKLAWLMNMYEYIRMKKIHWKFTPRFRNPTYTEGYALQYDSGNASTVQGYIGLAIQAFCEGAECIVMATKDDIIGRASTEEYYQVREDPRSMKFRPTQDFSCWISPFTMDTLQQYSRDQVNAVGMNNPQTDIVNNVGGANTTGLSANSTMPIPMPWVSTKAGFTQGGKTTNPVIGFNDQMQTNGLKFYIYTPFNQMPTTSTAAFVYGNMTTSYELEFKDPDNRALISGVALTARLNTQNDINNMKKLIGDQIPHKEMGQQLLPMSDLGIARKQILLNEEPLDPKRLKVSSDPPQGPHPSSQHTRPLQSFRTALADRGLK